MTIGENIKRIRIQRGITQDELGFLIGTDDAMIRKYENGTRIPKINRLEKIAFALGVNVEVLLNSEFNHVSAMHRLFQLFRQYDGYFDVSGNLHFRKMDLKTWNKRWEIYQQELIEARKIEDEQERQRAIEDAEDKFNWWMDTYPKSDCINRDFDKDLELYQKMKNKRRQEGSEKQP